jgi:hypothetical protein
VKKHVLEKLPFLVLSIADCVITVIAQKSGEAVVDAVGVTYRVATVQAFHFFRVGYLGGLVCVFGQ